VWDSELIWPLVGTVIVAAVAKCAGGRVSSSIASSSLIPLWLLFTTTVVSAVAQYEGGGVASSVPSQSLISLWKLVTTILVALVLVCAGAGAAGSLSASRSQHLWWLSRPPARWLLPWPCRISRECKQMSQTLRRMHKIIATKKTPTIMRENMGTSGKFVST
jgi:hypothetical protein